MPATGLRCVKAGTRGNLSSADPLTAPQGGGAAMTKVTDDDITHLCDDITDEAAIGKLYALVDDAKRLLVRTRDTVREPLAERAGVPPTPQRAPASSPAPFPDLP